MIKQTPQEIAEQISKLERHEMTELVNHITNSHPCDYKIFEDAFSKSIHSETVERLEDKIHVMLEECMWMYEGGEIVEL